ncbi:hypothetical protein [Lichenibacterium dinghuense]|uniref:hypothetical protein n=1 Tax=Lichenibacterium dinghuense TaxID=2895977 RepID=UPI001F1C2CEC|nr:hypothetical protein [Lichenibacterium sp. 6Y81]
MHDHATPDVRGLLRALALASALGVAALAAAVPAHAFDGGCCCDDGRYDSVGFGAAGTSGGFGFGGLGRGLGDLGGGVVGLGGGVVGGALGGLGGYGGPGYGAGAYGYGPATYGPYRGVPLRRAY